MTPFTLLVVGMCLVLGGLDNAGSHPKFGGYIMLVGVAFMGAALAVAM